MDAKCVSNESVKSAMILKYDILTDAAILPKTKTK